MSIQASFEVVFISVKGSNIVLEAHGFLSAKYPWDIHDYFP